MARRIRTHDWAATPFGHPKTWPQSLRSALSICLNSGIATAIYWGRDMRLLYNDAWSPIPGDRHPDALGKPAQQVWPDIWHVIEPQLGQAMRGDGFVTRDQYLPMQRHGYIEETYWDYSFTPIAGEGGEVAGIFNQGHDVTSRVFGERQQHVLLTLSDRARALETPNDIAATAVELLGEYLNVGRIAYAEIIGHPPMLRVDACWSNETMGPLSGTAELACFGDDVVESLRRGDPVAVNDVESDPRLRDPELRGTYGQMEAKSFAAAPVIRNGICVALLFAQHDRPREWNRGELDLLRNAVGRLWFELSRSRTEMALRESERRHRLIFEQARDFIFTADLDQTLSACNPATAEAIGLPVEQVIGRSIAEFLAPGEFERTTSMLKRKLAEGGTTRYEVAVRTALGAIRQWDVNSALTIDVDGYPIGLHAVARDITEKRAFDEQQQLLIDELNHRVKNTLALVQGLAMQSFKEDRTVAQGQEAFQARLAMLSAGHDLLTQTRWGGTTVSNLATDAMAPYRDPPGRVSIEGPPVKLAPKAAISLVLALHELGTNASKYGSLSVPEGQVAIRWAMDSERYFSLEWRETGGPSVIEPPRRGFGLRMLERALASDLGGTVSVEFAPQGLICRITATLPEQL